MLARLNAYSKGTSRDGMQAWHFDIDVRDSGTPLFVETISLEAVTLIADAHKQGPLYQLCRAIRDAEEGRYEALVGTEFGVE